MAHAELTSDEERQPKYVEERPPSRVWHVLGRFVPLLFLGAAFLAFGLSPLPPHDHGYSLGFVFVWIAGILLVGAVVGMLFTKCPICNKTTWVFCVQEPDVVRLPYRNGHPYGRDLARWNEKD